MALASVFRRSFATLPQRGRRPVARAPDLSQIQPRSARARDETIERALTLERARREKLGVEAAFQQEIDHWMQAWSQKSEQEVVTREKAEEVVAKVYERKVDKDGWANGTGRRKAAVAQVWIKPGDGLSMLVKREGAKDFRLLVDYFDEFQIAKATKPLTVVGGLGKFNMKAILNGGGLMGQAGALSLGIARALQAWDPENRTALKEAGHLTRDSRVVERKKPGQKKARKKFQWVKR